MIFVSLNFKSLRTQHETDKVIAYAILSTTSCDIRFPFRSHLSDSGCITSIQNVRTAFWKFLWLSEWYGL